MISQADEAQMAAARAARNRQDPDCPLLINIKDFRLMPNIPRLGGQKADRAAGKVFIAPHPDYRPYRGDPKATRAERQRLVETGTALLRPPVVDTSGIAKINEGFGQAQIEGQEPFDIGKAPREELVAFAKRWFGVELDNETGDLHLMKLRAKLRDLVKASSEAGTEDLT
jgi:hypothetical protein